MEQTGHQVGALGAQIGRKTSRRNQSLADPDDSVSVFLAQTGGISQGVLRFLLQLRAHHLTIDEYDFDITDPTRYFDARALRLEGFVHDDPLGVELRRDQDRLAKEALVCFADQFPRKLPERVDRHA